MPLTQAEQRALRAVVADLHRTDRRLARALSGRRVGLCPADVVTLVVGVVLASTLVAGVVFRLQILCAIAWTAIIPAVVVRAMHADSRY